MKLKIEIIIYSLILFTLCLFTFDNVYAKTNEEKVCLNSELYSISWDSDKATLFNINDVNAAAIEKGNTAPSGTTNVEPYKFSYTIVGSCYQGSNGDYYSCPTSDDLTVSLNDFVKLDSSYNYVNITQTLNTGNATYNVTIKDIYKNVSSAVTLRYVTNSSARNTNELNYNQIRSGFLTRNSNGWTISNVSPGSKLYIEVYLTTSTNTVCNGSYLGYFEIVVKDTGSYTVTNPAYTNPSEYWCDTIKANTQVPDSIKRSMIPQCYSSTISYSELSNLRNTIQTAWNRALSIYSSFPSSSSSSATDFVCTTGSKTSTNTNLAISQTGRYWTLNCYETYTAIADDPKLVAAGSGFEYQTQYEVSRTCVINQIARPTRKPACTTSYSSSCTYPSGQITNNNDPSRGGPSEDFDSCVSECDGGSYTQSCINTCYNKVYGEESSRTLDYTTPLEYKFEKTLLEKMISTDQSVTATKMGTTVIGYGPSDNCGGWYDCISGTGKQRKCRTCYTTIDGHTFTNEVSDYCGNHGVSCQYTKTVSPDGCVTNPEEQYNNELNASESELRNLEAIASSYENISTGTYQAKITDSHLKDANGNPYVYTVSSTSDPKLTVTTSNGSANDQSQSSSASLGASGGRSVNFLTRTVRTKTITVGLPNSYVSKVNGNVVYATEGNTRTAYQVSLENGRLFDRDSSFTLLDYYDKEYKYYTSIWSKNLNVATENKKVHLVAPESYNIEIISSNVGNGNFSSDIDCYYGVYNNYYNDDDITNVCDPDTEICDGGIQYIYRTIDLGDVFPNGRSPRWNWTGTLNSSTHTTTGAARFSSQTILQYNIDPSALITSIQRKADTIYNMQTSSSEVDYEFVLTRENLRNIRSYNHSVRDYNGDGYYNYLDYNMSCYTNSSGKEICTSIFLDNISGNNGTSTNSNFITYSVSGYNIAARKNLAGCNNSKSGACSEIGG